MKGPSLILVVGPSKHDPAAWDLVQIGHTPVAPDPFLTKRDRNATAYRRYIGQLLLRCDAVLMTTDADAAWIAELATWEDKPVYHRVGDVPPA